MGLQAAKWMLEALERKVDRAPRLYEASPELVVRTSSARPARQKGKSKKLLQNRT
jgi:DNA-binding LacI/PurR family transcriptional regulator